MTTIPHPAEPWVGIDEVAAHLGVRKDSVYRWIEKRGLPARKIGKLWKMKLSEIDEWVRAQGAFEASPARPPAEMKRALPRPVVLVVDDDDLVRDTVRDCLEDESYTVLLAAGAVEALARLAAAKSLPHVIVLDLKMPGMSGFEFRERQLADPRIAGIPVLVVTSDPKAAVPGATVLRKPVKLARLVEGIEALLPQ